MNLLRRARTAVADPITMNSGLFRNEEDEEEARLFQDFIESVSLSEEEMEAFIAMPGLSVPEVKRLFERR